MDVSVGFDGKVLPQSWTPVLVEFFNDGPPVEGLVEVRSATFAQGAVYAKPVVLPEAAVELANTLDDALVELSGLLDLSKIHIHRSYAHEGRKIPGDPRRLRQAFLNVLTNAAEAMPEGGDLTVSVRPAESDCVEVAIPDTGGGLDPEAVDRALRPFYSTKPAGTGLGLPLVARIIAAHQGGLAIESWPHAGTTVRITLPLVHDSDSRGA